MADEPISISWDELKTRKVEQRLREQDAVTRNRAYGRMEAGDLPIAAPSRSSFLSNTIVIMVLFGLMGGVLAWGAGFLLQFKSSERQAVELIRGIQRIEIGRNNGRISPAEADASMALLRADGQSNPYFAALDAPHLSFDESEARIAEVQRRARMKRFAMNVLSFGLSGLLLAMCLGVAEPLTERNIPKAVRNGALGAALGLIGGVVVSLFVDQLYRAAGGGAAHDPDQFTWADVLARACAWGVLGLFLAAGPGLLMGSVRKLLAGLGGGLLGGAIGGALFDPVTIAGGPNVGLLVALCAIGIVTGAATGLIENAAKAGWLRVTAGLIAGKQFILYRNPTYVGSGPECQIYLFRDPAVGRRHAALHLVPGGIELEDLPLGQGTLVNGKPVVRARLRHGDQIAIGATRFVFHEKVKKTSQRSHSPAK